MTTSIVKTWPAAMDRHRVLEAFTRDWGQFYFTLGRGKPSKKIDRLYFTHVSRILGHFDVLTIVQNQGQLPKLRRIDGGESAWQIKPDRWVAICNPPFHPLEEKLFMVSFRGYHYFDLESYRGTLDAKVRIYDPANR